MQRIQILNADSTAKRSLKALFWRTFEIKSEILICHSEMQRLGHKFEKCYQWYAIKSVIICCFSYYLSLTRQSYLCSHSQTVK